ncbi:MAG: hypothetical protein ACFFBD_01715, partial [Candidatus Hodarchaeota archaeon]
MLCIQFIMMAAFVLSILAVFPPGIEANTSTIKNSKAQFITVSDEINAENQAAATSESQKEQSASRAGRVFTYGDLTITTDKKQDSRDTQYKPGSIAHIDTHAPRSMLNGSVKWRLESPTSLNYSTEVVFDFGTQSNVAVNETRTQEMRTAEYTRDGVTSGITANVTTLIKSNDDVYVNVTM